MLWTAIALAALAAVEGTVIDAVTKSPLPGATVKLRQGDKDAHSGSTDAQGHFRIEGVADGEYRAVVWHDDYVELAWDHPAARRFVVSAANAEVRLRPELLPRAQIAGRVLSPAGEPMQGVPVGMRKLWHGAWTQTTISDAGGVFRFRRLEPGAWILAALPTFQMSFADPKKNPKPVEPPPDEEGQRVGWVWTYFPGSIDLAGAERTVLRPGAALEGYDIRLKTMPVRRLSGVVVDPGGKSAPKAGVFLADASTGGAGGGLATADAEGRFAFDAVIDGDWRLGAQFERSGQKLKGFTVVRVSRRDVSGNRGSSAGAVSVKRCCRAGGAA